MPSPVPLRQKGAASPRVTNPLGRWLPSRASAAPKGFPLGTFGTGGVGARQAKAAKPASVLGRAGVLEQANWTMPRPLHISKPNDDILLFSNDAGVGAVKLMTASGIALRWFTFLQGALEKNSFSDRQTVGICGGGSDAPRFDMNGWWGMAKDGLTSSR